MSRNDLYQVFSSNNLTEILTGDSGTYVAVPRGSTDLPMNSVCIRTHEQGSILGICTLDGREYDLVKVSDSPFLPVLEAAAKAANHWHERQFTSASQQGSRKLAKAA